MYKFTKLIFCLCNVVKTALREWNLLNDCTVQIEDEVIYETDRL